MRQRKYDYELIVQVRETGDKPSAWEDIEAVQTDSAYYLNLDYSEGTDPKEHRRAKKYAQYLQHESILAYPWHYKFRTIRRRTKKGVTA